jgi:hypothetical protein
MTSRTPLDLCPFKSDCKIDECGIVGLTPEIAVEVYNYDVDKFEKHLISQDENGTACEIKEWRAPE